jgi:hypothetical protein
MASSDYKHGEMSVDSQASMYAGFMKAGMWGALIIMLLLGYSTFTLSIGMHWMVALALCAGAGIGIGMFMNMGGAWIATVIVLSGLAVFIQILIGLFSLVF